jgi:trimeric autotransporter adhesin
MTLANAAAAYTIPAGTLSAGANTLTATYSGDGTFASETATTSITVAPVVMAAPAPSPVAAGGTATATVTLSAGSTYSGTMNLSCTLKTSPANAQSPPTCGLSPATVTIASGGNATTTLTAKTTGGTSANAVQQKNGLWGLGNRALTLATLLMIGMRLRRRWTWMVALVVMGIAFGIAGCGGGHSSPPVTPPTTTGTYVFSVTATDSKNTAITSSANVSVKVQ